MFDSLTVPCPNEYILYYSVSVQTAYVESVECMLTSNHYIKSGINEIDNNGSNDMLPNLMSKFKNGMEGLSNMISSIQSDHDQAIDEKFNAVVYMTNYYYKKKDITVNDPGTLLGDVKDVNAAESRLIARRCESSYTTFTSDIKTLKAKYTSQASNYVSKSEWQSVVNSYYSARVDMVNKTNIYSAIRDAHLHGLGINKCKGSANTDQKLTVSEVFFDC